MAQSIVERGEIPPVKAKISRQMRWWGSKPPAWGLLGFGGAVALLMLIPLAYIVVRASTANAETWESLWSRRIPMLLTNTLSLTAVVTLGSVVLGVTLAWLTTRTDLPGRAWLDWLIAMPLAVPPYVGALCYITAFDHSGLAEQFTGGLYDLKLGERAWVYGFWGAAIILILYTYPYVYLNVAAALRNSNRNLEEASRSLGKSGWRFFWHVQLPLLRPAISAGALVTAFYMLSEFGVVSLLRYETFTVTIFRQLGARNDNNAAAILSGVLLVMTLLILWGENRAHRSQSRYWQISGQWKPARPQTLGIWKFPALGLVGLVLTAALWLPLLVLFYWLIREVSTTPPNWERLWEFSFNSLWSGALAATLSVILSLPLAYLAARYSGIFGRWLPRLATAGNALPGVVVALSMIFLFNN
jgi:iron(III) transport system permease protein